MWVKKAGFTRKTAQTGAVTLIQRFGSALNLNIHYHMLFLDRVYTETESGQSHFHRVKSPSQEELQTLVHKLSLRIGRYLERQGLIERDMENSYLSLEGLDDNPLTELHGHSITYRIAVGPQRGQKGFRLQTLPPDVEQSYSQVGQSAGFSLHAGLMAEAYQRQKLERLCR
jgi:hypothetical protein